MTSSLPIEQINVMLDLTNSKDKHIHITSKISQSIEFLDVLVENKNEELNKSIYHKSMAELYIIPYASDHARHIHKNMPYVGLLRAARLCSSVKDFDAERLNLEMILSFNAYPPKFISHHVKPFFTQLKAMSVWTELDRDAYQQLLHKLTRQEKELRNTLDHISRILRIRISPIMEQVLCHN